MRLEEADAFDVSVWIGGLSHEAVERLVEQFLDLVDAVGGDHAAMVRVADDAKSLPSPSKPEDPHG